MTCPKCKGNNVSTQMVTETETKKKHKPLYWLFIGWWWEPLMWIFLTIPMLFYKIFKPKKYNTKTTTRTVSVCQDCGKTF